MTRMTMRAVLAATLLILCACGVHAPQRSSDATLEGTQWRLVRLGDRPAHAQSGEGTPSLRLDAAQKRASGNTGCNGFSGGYELRGDQLRFGALVSTRRACAEPAMNRQEAELVWALGETRTWHITGDTLILRGAAGDVARFATQAAT